MSFILRRIIATVPVVLGVATITFFLLHLVPGDPVDLMLGEQATAADRQALRHELGLDRPVSESYVTFLSGLTKFDLGRSLMSRRPVAELLAERLPATAELAFSSMLLALLTGVPLGVLAAVYRRTWLDRVLRASTLVGTSAPSYWIGPMLVLVFAIQLDWLPVSERGGWDHLVLPALTLSLGLSSVLLQITRASMLEVVRQDFIATARAKGVAPFGLWFKHALANALIPIITVAGLQFGAILTGTVIIETIFDWPGIGTLLFQGIQQRDYPLVQGCVLVIALLYVVVNLLTDLAYSAANPKVRLA